MEAKWQKKDFIPYTNHIKAKYSFHYTCTHTHIQWTIAAERKKKFYNRHNFWSFSLFAYVYSMHVCVCVFFFCPFWFFHLIFSSHRTPFRLHLKYLKHFSIYTVQVNAHIHKMVLTSLFFYFTFFSNFHFCCCCYIGMIFSSHLYAYAYNE